MFLTDLSLKRPVLATVSILALIALGIMSYFSLGINDWPDVEFPYVAITVVEPGATPAQLESKVARPLEDVMGQVSGVDHIYSTIQDNVALVYAEFTLDTDPSAAAQDVRDKVGTIRATLPDDIREPVISRIDPTAQPIMSLALTGNIPLTDLTNIVNDTVTQRLEGVEGVGAVNIQGQQTKEVQIQLDENKMAQYGLTVFEVTQSLSAQNIEAPAGSVITGDHKINLRTNGKVQSVEDFADLPVARRNGVQLYVRDIAKVVMAVKDPDSITFFQGKPAVGIDIIKQSGSNTVKVAAAVQARVQELQSSLPSNVQLSIVRDNSVTIRNSVSDVVKTILEGGILAVLTVLLFLGNIRTTIISAIAIPASIITTFFAMRILGYTLNNMSLMALSLSVGLLIDDAIVVIENIERHLKMGKPPLTAAKEATSEIGLAVMATTFTIVAVFLPVGMMGGITGKFFKQFGITVVVAVLVSLLVSFTLVPLLSSRYLQAEEKAPRGPLGKFLGWFSRMFDGIAEGYGRFLHLVLRNRLKTLAIALLFLIGSLALIPFLGISFMPSSDTGELDIITTLDSGLTNEVSADVTHRVEDVIKASPDVDKIYSTIKNGQLDVYVKIKDKKDRQNTMDQTVASLRTQLRNVPGVQASVNVMGFMQIGKDVQYSLLGDDMTELQNYAEKTQKLMESIPGVTDVSSSYSPGSPQESIQVQSKAASDLGVSPGMVASALNTLYTGTVVSQFKQNDDSYDVRLILDPQQRQSLSGLDHIYLPGNTDSNGIPNLISLDQVTKKEYTPASSTIYRYDRMPEVLLTANLSGVSLGEFQQKFDAATKKLNLPPGYKFVALGQSEFMGESFTAMGEALVIGVLFIFFILAAQFESYIDPFSIMFSLPMAIIGAILALLLTGDDFGMVANIGIIMLMGLVTKNAILLVDFAKQARAQGMDRNDALVRAGRTRLRPIVMTSVAMIFGMLPLALGLGQGAESRAPMAHAIIGGLITSTLLTLIVVPIMYSLFDDLRRKVRPSANVNGVKGMKGNNISV